MYEAIVKALVLLPVCGVAIGFACMAIDVACGFRDGWTDKVGNFGGRLALVSLFTLIVFGLFAFAWTAFLK